MKAQPVLASRGLEFAKDEHHWYVGDGDEAAAREILANHDNRSQGAELEPGHLDEDACRFIRLRAGGVIYMVELRPQPHTGEQYTD